MVSPGAEPDPELVTAVCHPALDVGCWTPQLRQSVQPGRNFADPRVANDLACEALHQFRQGVLVVAADARVLFANRAAARLLAEPHGALRIEEHRLWARRRADCAALRRLIRLAVRQCAAGSFVLSRQGRPTLIVLVMPATPAAAASPHHGHAIIVVKDLEGPATRSSGAWARYFALTPAQTAVADQIIRGDGVSAAARRLRISYGTARAHLLQIFQKTGVRRQTELVRLILEWDDGIGQMADAVSGESP